MTIPDHLLEGERGKTLADLLMRDETMRQVFQEGLDNLRRIRASLRLAKCRCLGTPREREIADVIHALGEPIGFLEEMLGGGA